MRYDAEHKQRTRERVLKEAAKAIRAEGPHKLGVAGVMARAGLTHGGFYAHFGSRDAFVAEAIGQMFEDGPTAMLKRVADQPPRQALRNYINFYLSVSHRDTVDAGCPLPFLAAEAPRLANPSRERYAKGAAKLTQTLATHLAALDVPHPEDEASAMLAQLVGAVSLARAETDPERSDAILSRSRAQLKRRLGLEAAQ